MEFPTTGDAGASSSLLVTCLLSLTYIPEIEQIVPLLSLVPLPAEASSSLGRPRTSLVVGS